MTSPLTPERKQGMRERIEAAAKGPWFYLSEYSIIQSASGTEITAMPQWDDRPDDFEFIAHARTDLPDLYESHEALVEALSRSGHLSACAAEEYRDDCGREKADKCEWEITPCETHSPERFACNCGRDAALRNAGVQP